MKCPCCGLIDHDTKIIDSRQIDNTVKRIRKCSFCGFKWKTYEVLEEKYLYLASRDKTGRKFWTRAECKNLVLFREQGLTYKTIAERLGRSWQGVRQQTKDLLDSGQYFKLLEEVKVRC
jgi:transcriptional regulator NrdR family protein